MLAGVALYTRRAERLAFAGAALGSLAVVVGVPGITQVVTRLPVFSSGHNRFTMVWVLGVALLPAGASMISVLDAAAAWTAVASSSSGCSC